MSPVELQIVAQKQNDILVTVEPLPPVGLAVTTTPDLVVLLAGNIGPPGPPGQWVALTLAEYDALNPPDADTLYVIIE